jgi:hypothetical protein
MQQSSGGHIRQGRRRLSKRTPLSQALEPTNANAVTTDDESGREVKLTGRRANCPATPIITYCVPLRCR